MWHDAPERRVPSPGGWTPPPGVIPAWNWTASGIEPRLDRIPRWVRVWYRTPLIDRWAYAWMWKHGGWDVAPRSDQEYDRPPGS
jgi:hypothetical protein